MATYKGLQFGERGENGTFFPTYGAEADETIQRIPGGTRTVIQTSGQVRKELPTTGVGTLDQIKALRNVVGSVPGTLVYSAGVENRVYLKRIGTPKEAKKHGKYIFDIQFVVL